MKYTLKSVREEVWRILNEEVTVIRIQKVSEGASAYSTYNDTEIDIFIDTFQTRIDYAVVHEILHKIFDKHFSQFATYHIYEYWIAAMEAPLFKGMRNKDYDKWRELIASKTVRSKETILKKRKARKHKVRRRVWNRNGR